MAQPILVDLDYDALKDIVELANGKYREWVIYQFRFHSKNNRLRSKFTPSNMGARWEILATNPQPDSPAFIMLPFADYAAILKILRDF